MNHLSKQEEEFELIDTKLLNVFKYVSVLFYTKDDENKFNFILTKQDESIVPINTEITDSDNSPLVAITRYLAQHFQSLFTDESLDKISKREKIEFDRAYNPDFFVGPRLMSNKSFIEYTNKFTNNPIQFDSVKGQILLFYELKQNLDIDFVNENLIANANPFQFISLSETELIKLCNNNNSKTINNNLKKLIEKIAFLTEASKNPLSDFINNSEVHENSDTYCIISCLPKNKESFLSLGYFMFRALFLGKYRRNNERWIEYRAELNQYPDHDTLTYAKAVVLPGSMLHVYNNDEQTITTINWLNKTISNYKNLRFLGICYGHQLITEALGGKVNLRPDKHLFTQIEKVIVNKEFKNFSFVKNSGIDLKTIDDGETDFFTVMQVHSDEVSKKPDRLIGLGKSDSCQDEISTTEDGQVLTFQGHPEYTPAFYFFRTCLSNYDHSVQKFKKANLSNVYNDEDIKEYFEDLKKFTKACEANHKLNDHLAHICHSFIKNN